MDKPKLDIQNGIQVLITDRLQLGDVLTQLLEMTGPADLTISTFSSGEEFLRKLLTLRHAGAVRSASLYTDFKAAEKTARTNAMLRCAFDELRLCPNHSKIMVVQGDQRTFTLFTSQNQTRGNRLESYVIIEGTPIAAYAIATLSQLKTYPLWTETNSETK